ncbi:MAG: hypothetical protein Q8908_12715 [Bacteroidota bacterium]|nr:hypothetical protein [Bacteroidota bacterium]
MSKHPGIDYHRMAAEHHEKASQHHKKAAEYYEAGDYKKAAIHAELAEVYHNWANEHLKNRVDEKVELPEQPVHRVQRVTQAHRAEHVQRVIHEHIC